MTCLLHSSCISGSASQPVSTKPVGYRALRQDQTNMDRQFEISSSRSAATEAVPDQLLTGRGDRSSTRSNHTSRHQLGIARGQNIFLLL